MTECLSPVDGELVVELFKTCRFRAVKEII